MAKIESISSPLKSSQDKIRVATHDLSNLLNNVLSSIELIKDSVTNDLGLLNLATNIENNTLLASEIIQNLSSNNSIVKSNKSRINISQIIADTIDVFNNGTKNNIEIEFQNSEEEIIILGYATEIKRILLNLIRNAEEASKEKSRVNISIHNPQRNNQKKTNYLKVTVSDNGPGIPKKILNKIFDEGFTSKDRSTNSGVGLSIVKSIMNSHDGRVEVTTKRNEGTSFNLFFPIEDNSNNASRMENKKVIIAEDDKFQREVLKDLLTSMKLNVFTAKNGVEALDLYISTKPDILFIDENMPGMNGLECTKKIREVDNSSQIVLVTGSTIDNNYIEGKVSRVLRKPYNFEMVKTTLKELL